MGPQRSSALLFCHVCVTSVLSVCLQLWCATATFLMCRVSRLLLDFRLPQMSHFSLDEATCPMIHLAPAASCLVEKVPEGAGATLVLSHDPGQGQCLPSVCRITVYSGRTCCGMIAADSLKSFLSHALTQILTHKPVLKGRPPRHDHSLPILGVSSSIL